MLIDDSLQLHIQPHKHENPVNTHDIKKLMHRFSEDDIISQIKHLEDQKA